MKFKLAKKLENIEHTFAMRTLYNSRGKMKIVWCFTKNLDIEIVSNKWLFK